MGASPEHDLGGRPRFLRKRRLASVGIGSFYSSSSASKSSTSRSPLAVVVVVALALFAASAVFSFHSSKQQPKDQSFGFVLTKSNAPRRIFFDSSWKKKAGRGETLSSAAAAVSAPAPLSSSASSASPSPSSSSAAPSPSVAEALETVRSLRELFDQQRASQTAEQASLPSSAGLRAAAAVALDAAALSLSSTPSSSPSSHLRAAKQQLEDDVLSSLMRRQFPQDCSGAKLLVGAIDKFCGFACQIHHAVHLLAAAAATGRTLVLYTDEWRYDRTPEENEAVYDALDSGLDEPELRRDRSENRRGAPPRRHTEGRWETLFLPVTNCTTPAGTDWAKSLPRLVRSTEDGGDSVTAPAVVAGIVDGGAGALKSDPPSVPPDVLRRASEFTSRPEVWWSGVLADFLLRPSAEAEEKYSRFARASGLDVGRRRSEREGTRGGGKGGEGQGAEEVPKGSGLGAAPYAAVHIRRTDKVVSVDNGKHAAEAEEVPLEKYFAAVDAWLAATESKRGGETGDGGDGVRRLPTVYVATDDPEVLSELRSSTSPHRYSRKYRIVANDDAASSASRATRWGPESLAGVASDLYFLSRAEFLVGTFSSQVSRLAYELMQGPSGPSTPSADATLRYHSADASHWFMGGGGPVRFCAVAGFEAKVDYGGEDQERVAAVLERMMEERRREEEEGDDADVGGRPPSPPAPLDAPDAGGGDEGMRRGVAGGGDEGTRRGFAGGGDEGTRRGVAAVQEGDPLHCGAAPETKEGLVKCRLGRIRRDLWVPPTMLRRCPDFWRLSAVLT